MPPLPPLRFSAPLQRKDPRLPVYVVVPHASVAHWQLGGTTVVEGTVNGRATGRRTIKRWDASPQSDWFVEFTAPFCQRAGIAVGDSLEIQFVVAQAGPPAELAAALGQAPAAQAAWRGLSEARRRAIGEHVRAGKSAATRERRAALAVQGLAPSGGT